LENNIIENISIILYHYLEFSNLLCNFHQLKSLDIFLNRHGGIHLINLSELILRLKTELLSNQGFMLMRASKKPIKEFLTVFMNHKCFSLKLKMPMKSSIFKIALSFCIIKLMIFYGLAAIAWSLKKKMILIKKKRS
jgi:hypothetical protein